MQLSQRQARAWPYGGGQMAAFLFGIVMFAAGARHIVRHFSRA